MRLQLDSARFQHHREDRKFSYDREFVGIVQQFEVSLTRKRTLNAS